MADIIPEGYYEAVATRVSGEDGEDMVRFGLASNDTKQALVYFKLIDSGQVLPWFGYFTKASYKRTVESFRYMGFKGDDLAAINSQELLQKVSVQIEHDTRTVETDDGPKEVTRARICWVNRVGRGAIKLKKPMSKVDLGKFAAMMKATLSSIGDVDGEVVKPNGSGGTGTASAPAEAPAEEKPFDDIPF